MKLKITEVHIYSIPKLIEPEVRDALKRSKSSVHSIADVGEDDLNELLSDCSDLGIEGTVKVEVIE